MGDSEAPGRIPSCMYGFAFRSEIQAGQGYMQNSFKVLSRYMCLILSKKHIHSAGMIQAKLEIQSIVEHMHAHT